MFTTGESVRVNKSSIFMLVWVAFFSASVYSLPSVGIPLLLSESFLNAVAAFGASYAVLSLFRKGTTSKLAALALVLLLAGATYQNQAGSNQRAAGSVLEVENSYLASLVGIIGERSLIAPQPGAAVPIQFSIPPALLRAAPPSPAFKPADPTIRNGTANITFPVDYAVMANSVLESINRDRANSGLAPLSLSSSPVGQQHADSMLYYNYYSHWDTQGYKPYMRYTLLGGSGAVSENIALSYCTVWPARSPQVFPSTCTTPTIENALNNSEWQMMHNDLGCCDNGHRSNILDPFHNKVSIGIAYDVGTHEVMMVEDFENSYLSVGRPIFRDGDVTLSGTVSGSLQLYSVAVNFDPPPVPLNASRLAGMPHGYDAGRSVGAVFAPCASGYYCPPTTIGGGVAVYATSWKYSNGEFTIQFPLSSFAERYGRGIYTLYLFDDQKDILTSLCVFTQ